MTDTGPTIDCVIVGGGFTGLSAAFELLKAGKSVKILEADSSLGGLAGGFVVNSHELEKFYHHWFVSDRYVTELAAEIGAADKVITRGSRTGMYFAGNIYRLSTPLDLLKFKALPFFDRIRTGVATLSVRNVRNWKKLEDITARDWLVKKFGLRAFKVMWEPLLVGKFGHFANDVAAVWFWKKVVLRGSSRAKSGGEALAYYRGGFAAMARDLGAQIAMLGGQIGLNEPVKTIRQEGDVVKIETCSDVYTARQILITTAFPIAADMLEGAMLPEETARLRRIQYLANICLVLKLDRSLSDTYWLNVNDPSFPFVGVIEHTNFEPPESYGGRHIVFLSKYLPDDDPFYQLNAEQAFEFALPHIKKMFPAFESSWVLGRHVWKADYAQPIVERNYSDMLPGLETSLPNVFISTMAQVYPEDRGHKLCDKGGAKRSPRLGCSCESYGLIKKAATRLGERPARGRQPV